ncbi:MAG: AMP-binding protein [Eubacteriales bacterium]
MPAFYKRFVKSEVFNEKGELTKFELDAGKEDFNFSYDVVDVIAKETPEKLAILWVNDKGEERRITFRELSETSDKVAAFLMSRGIKRGDMVMVLLKRHFEYWFTYLALHKIGAVTIPATTQLQVKDLTYRFREAGVKAVICTSEGDIARLIDEADKDVRSLQCKVICCGQREGWLSFDEGITSAPEFVRPTGELAPVGSDISLLFFTSGTTGMPKMVIHDFFYPLAHIFTAIYWHKVVDGGLHLTVADTGWAKTAWGKMYGQWMGGSAQFIYDHEKFNAAEMLHILEKYEVTTFCAPPTIYRFFIKEDLKKYKFKLVHTTIAGEALNPEVYEKFLAGTGLKLMEGYGQTEHILAVVNEYYVEPRPGSMGKPTPYIDVDIVDENNASCPAGVNGEIVLRVERGHAPYGMFMGYYKDEAMTSGVWSGGIYRTGDIAWRDEDGYFWYVGRTDDIIKSSGYRIGPFEVESVIMEHPAVLECAVTAVPDEVRGQIVKATIVLSKGYEPSDSLKKEIQDYVKTHTAPYKYPRVLEFVNALPKTISGKIRRVEIRQNKD